MAKLLFLLFTLSLILSIKMAAKLSVSLMTCYLYELQQEYTSSSCVDLYYRQLIEKQLTYFFTPIAFVFVYDSVDSIQGHPVYVPIRFLAFIN